MEKMNKIEMINDKRDKLKLHLFVNRIDDFYQ